MPLALGKTAGSFHGSVRLHALGPGIELSEVHTWGASVVVRSPRLVRTEPRDDCLFSLHVSGEGSIAQGDQESELQSGGGALYDSSRPYELRFPTDSREFVLRMPRTLLRDRTGGFEAFCGIALPADQPAVRVLAAYVAELAANCDELTRGQRAELGVTAVDLLATAVRAVSGKGSGLPTGSAALLAAMRAFVHDHLSDPELTAEALVRGHGVSLRYTAGLFSADGSSPAAYIRSERLRAAHRMLSDPRFTRLPISAVAARCGFSDRTTFTVITLRRAPQLMNGTAVPAPPGVCDGAVTVTARLSHELVQRLVESRAA